MLARKAETTVPMTRARVTGAFVKPEASIVAMTCMRRCYFVGVLRSRRLRKGAERNAKCLFLKEGEAEADGPAK